jgi:diacylglycerol O-acyltransferase / wax synthase
VAALTRGLVGQGLRTARDPARLRSGARVGMRGAERLAHLATIPPKPRIAVSGPIGTAKQVTWTDRQEGTPLESVRVMVPVNLRPLDEPLTSDLGNVFGEYVVTLPTGVMRPRQRLTRMHQIIEELKDSPEAFVAYLTLVAIGWLPEPVEDLSTRLFSGKVVATVSNVPGPRTPVTLAGTPVSGIIGWVPAAGDVGLGVSMFSYDDRVLIGLLADVLLIPDLDRLSAHVTDSLADLTAALPQ